MKLIFQSAACAALLTISASAADIATLRNGFTIRHEHREITGDNTRLYLAADRASFVDVSTAEIVSFEPDLTPAVPEPASTAAPNSIPDHISEASKLHGIDADFIASVIRSESSNNPRAVSPKGARGLMQLMPQTADQLGVKDSFDPAANIDGGTRYLRDLLVQYNGDAVKALAAYNAGPHRVKQYKGVPPFRETRAYVAKTIRDYNRRKKALKQSATTRSTSTTKPSTKQTTKAAGATSRKPA